MKIFTSSPRFAYLPLLIVSSFFLYFTYDFFQKHYPLSLFEWSMMIIGYNVLYVWFLYLRSERIIFEKEKIVYEAWFVYKEMSYEEITEIEINHKLNNIQRSFPVIHVVSEKGEMEIPSAMFSKELINIIEELRERI